jgi:hypothetical protein
VDPERLLGLGATLESLRTVARDGADEALEHFPEVGDRVTQNALDALLEQLADTLRAVDAEATEVAGRLRIAATSVPGPAGTPSPADLSGGSPADSSVDAPVDDLSTPPRKGLFR